MTTTERPHRIEHVDRGPLDRDELAAAIARDIPAGSYVNLGIGVGDVGRHRRESNEQKRGIGGHRCQARDAARQSAEHARPAEEKPIHGEYLTMPATPMSILGRET